MFHFIQALFIERYWSEFSVPPPFPYFDRTPMGRALEAAGIVRTHRLGSATVTCVESRPMVDTSVAVLARNPAAFFQDGEQSSFARWYQNIPARRRRLQAGAAKLAITPIRDIAGDIPLLEPLHVRALVLGSEQITVAIVVCDMRGLGRRHVTAARRLVAEQTGIPAAHVMIACTHNHAGPDTILPGEAAEPFRSDVVVKIAESVAIAHIRTQDARFGTARTPLEGIVQNRRQRLADGRVLTLRRFVPSSWKPYTSGKYRAGTVDRELTVLRLEKLTGEPIALFSSLGCHNDTGGMYAAVGISGDFFGHAMLTLERLYPGCTALIGFGAGGDVDFDLVPHLILSRARNDIRSSGSAGFWRRSLPPPVSALRSTMAGTWTYARQTCRSGCGPRLANCAPVARIRPVRCRRFRSGILPLSACLERSLPRPHSTSHRACPMPSRLSLD